jgi:phosphoglycolate phosphatase
VTFRNFKAIFFDWDNTLVDTWPVLLDSSNAVLRHFGKSEISLEEVKIRARLSSRESFPEQFGESWENIKLFDGAASLIESLKKSNKIVVIISNKKKDLLRSEVKRFGISNDLILGSGDATFDKPHPEMGIIALKHFQLQPNEVVYVGDSITDWNFAKNLDMPAIAIGDEAYEGPLLARFSSINESMQEFIS